MSFSDATQVNPSVPLRKGQEYSFVEMQAVEPSWRDVSESERRVFTSGGSRFMPGDTLMARITPCLENGKIARYRPRCGENEPAFGSTEFIVIRGRDGVTDNDYAYYLTKWQDFRQYAISQMTGSSGRQRVPASALENFLVPVPPLPEQRAIAHVLGTLDDKIECNRKMNRTLEGIVRALFKSWFIDFDPVIDNALAAGKTIPDELADRVALRQQAAAEYAKPLPDDLRTLFPDEFTQTDTMGWIPKGWEVAPLSTLARLNPHAWTAKNSPMRVRYLDLANTKTGSINEVVEYTFDSAPSRARRILYPGDTVFGTVRPGNRSFAYIQEEGLTGSTGFAVLHPLRAAYREFIYLATTRNEIVDLFAHLADGAAYPAVRPEVVIEQVHAMPPTQIVEAFHDSVADEIVSIGQRSAQNQKLSSLRDTLLPKLLSGELPVPLAAMQVEEDGDGGARRHPQVSARHHFDPGWKDKVEELA